MPSFTFNRSRIFLLFNWLGVFAILLFSARLVIAQTEKSFDITLEELGYNEKTMRGPTAQSRYFFSLPADWNLLDNNNLELDLTYNISGREGEAPAFLEIVLNNNVLQTETFETPGSRKVQIEIPADILRPAEDNQLNELEINFLVSGQCEEGQLTSLIVRPSSTLHFEYANKPLQLDLALLPQPLYRARAFEQSLTTIIVPAEPQDSDIQAAIMVAAGLGSLSNDNMSLAVASPQEQLDKLVSDEHLVVVGRPDNNALLQNLDLPLPLKERQLNLSSQMPVAVQPGESFSYTLMIENTSSIPQSLTLIDDFPHNAVLLECSGCAQSETGLLRWNMGQLEPGEQATVVVSLELNSMTEAGEKVEHTASLLNEFGEVINVDTLASLVGTGKTNEMVASASDKTPYFFALDNLGVSETDGLLQILPSPWSPRHAIIVVTGLTDQALFKSAYALGAQTQFPGMSGQYALIQEIQPETDVELLPINEISLSDLGYSDTTLSGSILDAIQYNFDIPSGLSSTDNSALTVHFSHSAALSELPGTLEARLNNTPIGSIQLNQYPTTGAWATFPLPATRLRTGSNRITLQINAPQSSVCIDSGDTSLWLTAFADSFLNLSYNEAPLIPRLERLPQPFSDVSDLNNLAFALPLEPTIEELQGVIRLASRLASATNGKGFKPQVYLGENPKEQTLTGQNIIAVGRPTNNQFISAINELLPQPFHPGRDEIAQQLENVEYRLPPDIDLGFVQQLLSPWDENQVMLVVTGTSDRGVAWGLNATTDPALRWQLEGNLALIRDTEIETLDTRKPVNEEVKRSQASASESTAQNTGSETTQSAAPTPTPEPTENPTTVPSLKITATPTSIIIEATEAPKVERTLPGWFFPIFIFAVLTGIITIVITIWRGKQK